MCKDHNKVCGKEAVALFAEARVLGNVCGARFNYLRRQAVSFHQWLASVGCDDPTAVCARVVRDIERTLKEQGPDACTNTPDDELNPTLWDIHADMGDLTLRMDDEEACHIEYQQELERIALRSLGSVEAKLAWYDSKLFRLNQELQLHDTIQDALDGIPSYGCAPYDKVDELLVLAYQHSGEQRKAIFKAVTAWKHAGNITKRAFQYIDRMRKEKKLSYNAWFAFNNQLLEKIGREQKEYPYGEMHLLADTITYYENRRDMARQKIEEDKPLVRCEELPPENYVALLDEVDQEEEAQQLLSRSADE